MGAALALVVIAFVVSFGLGIYVIYLNGGNDPSLAEIPTLLRARFGRFCRFLKVLDAKLDKRGFITRFAKANAAVTINPNLYSLICTNKSGVHGYGLYPDAKHSILLNKGGRAIALIGFDIEGDTIFVKQIQGRQGYKEHLAPLKWERMLLAIVVEAARQSKCKEVRVQPARKNPWCAVSETADHGHGRMLYDVTARRSGFKFDPKEDCFKLALT